MDHDDGMWCWCRPKAEDLGPGRGIFVIHREIDPTTLMSRYFHGGPGLSGESGRAVWWWDDFSV